MYPVIETFSFCFVSPRITELILENVLEMEQVLIGVKCNSAHTQKSEKYLFSIRNQVAEKIQVRIIHSIIIGTAAISTYHKTKNRTEEM